jgi:hypothetical protein
MQMPSIAHRLRGVSNAAALLALILAFVGCGPQGAGTIKVSPAARSAIEPSGPTTKKPLTAQQARLKALEEDARKKDPKRY